MGKLHVGECLVCGADIYAEHRPSFGMKGDAEEEEYIGSLHDVAVCLSCEEAQCCFDELEMWSGDKGWEE